MPRRTAAEAAATRTDILRAARRMFAARGYAATTTGEIAEAASVTAGALFHHFDGKAGLFRSVLEELELELDEHIRSTAGDQTGLDAFLLGFRAYLSYARRRDFHRIVMVEGPAVLGEAEWHSVEGRRVAETLMEGIDHLVAEGVLEDRPRQPLGVLLLGAMREAGFQVARRSSARSVDDLVDAMRRLLAPHLAKSPRGVARPTRRTPRSR